MACIAQEAGIPSAAIILESASTTTFENALFARETIEKHAWQSAIVVTEDYHRARAWLTFRRLGFGSLRMAGAGNADRGVALALQLCREALAIPYYLLLKLRALKRINSDALDSRLRGNDGGGRRE